MMNISKVISHASDFHADEIFGIALLRYLGVEAPIERKFKIEESEFADPTILILDVGKKFEP